MQILVKWNRFEDADFTGEEGEDLVHFREVVRLRPKELWIHNPVINPLSYLLFEARAQLLCVLLRYPVNYFSIRHRLDTSARRAADIAFCIHVLIDHYGKHEPMSRSERLRYYWLYYARYRREQEFFLSPAMSKDPQYAEYIRHYNAEYTGLYIGLQRDDQLGYFHREG